MHLRLMMILLLLAAATRSIAKEPELNALEMEMRMLAEEIAGILAKQSENSIAVGAFLPSHEIVGDSSPGIQLALAKELQAAKLTVDNQNYRFEISGHYQPFHDTAENRIKTGGEGHQATNLNAVKLVAFLIDRETGEPLPTRPESRLIFGSETAPQLLGLNVSGPPLRDPMDLSDQWNNAATKPQILVAEAQLVGSTKRYAVEILAAKDEAVIPLPIAITNESPRVSCDGETHFVIRLHNHSESEAAVKLRIAGVDTLSFAAADRPYWIVPSQGHVDVKGWTIEGNEPVAFRADAVFPEIIGQRIQMPEATKQVLISSSFSACWKDAESRPADEPEIQGRCEMPSELSVESGGANYKIGQVRDTLSLLIVAPPATPVDETDE